MQAKVTKHAALRIRTRLGLPRRAVERAASNAMARGRKRTEFSGPLRRYLDKVYHKGVADNAATDIRVYGQFIYLFAGPYLLTCWRIPAKFRPKKPVSSSSKAPNQRGTMLKTAGETV